MRENRERPPWQEDNSRRAAFNFLVRYWGLRAAQKERGMISVPMLPVGEVHAADE